MPLESNDLRILSQLLADAIQQSTSNAVQAAAANNAQQNTTPRVVAPPVSITGYKTVDYASVQDYFTRCEWSFQLSRITETEYKNYVLVHMGAELNNALKILVSPRVPEDLTYDEIKSTLVNHFDGKRNQYAESVKFRQIIQEKGESVSDFTLRLRQAAAYCNYGNSLDRMLTEQMLCGLESSNSCDEIIAKEPASFKDAYELAQRLEASHRSAVEMKSGAAGSNPLIETTYKVGYKSAKVGVGNKHIPLRKKVTNDDSPNGTKCYGCGGNHNRNQCKFRNATCYACNKTGHIAKVCRTRTDQISDDDTGNDSECIQRLNRVSGSKINKHMIEVLLNKKKVTMEFDSGAPCGIISIGTLRKILGRLNVLPTSRRFTSYTGHKIKVIGRVVVNVTVGHRTRRLNVYVVDGDYDSLFGREWIQQFVNEIDFKKMFCSSEPVGAIKVHTPHLSSTETQLLQNILFKFENIFSTSAGKLDMPPIKLHLKQDAKPVFARAREIPVALRDAYAAEIEKKIASGFYKRVDFSEWASTTHVVAKKDGRIRITGNYKPTVNPRIIVDEHPIPKPENIFNKMNGAKLFCHLDVTDAYSHLPIDNDLAHALTLNTPTHGLIRPTRAVYGAANIPAIWQRAMESVLQGIPNVCNFFDDILIYAENLEKLLSVLETTLSRLQERGLKLNRAKCVFAAPGVEFLGHKIDSYGIHKSDKHVAAVRDAPRPKTHEELQLFLGKANYYGSFIPNLATRNRPLRDVLLRKEFRWTVEAERAYEDIKRELISPRVLTTYSPELPLLLATDASQVGLGAVLSHRLSDGRERPIAYASRTLSKTERKYSQIDKEALAIVWAVQKFFMYLYARHFTLITDHKPLTQILDPHKSLPVLCISRMANYAEFLGNFDYSILFKTTKANANADYCSRAVRNDIINKIEQLPDWDDFDSFIVKQIEQLPTSADQIASETRKDVKLGEIVRILENGKSLQAYGYKSPEIKYRLAGNCLIFEHRIVVPEKLRRKILQDLHSAHLGIVKMKGIARSFVYWPGIDKDIEEVARSCTDCSKYSNDPPKFRDHHWHYPKGPWERIHVDYAGPVLGSMLLVITDAYSKWIEVKVTHSSTSAATINILDELFAAYGVPATIVTDNGTCFASAEFGEFLTNVGVKYHKFTAPYHPSTNGQAERSVQTIKNALKSAGSNRKNLQKHLNLFLRYYRIAPHSTTGKAPSTLFLGRLLRTHLNLLLPKDVSSEVAEKQYMEFTPSFRTVAPMQNVYFRSYNNHNIKWLPGVVLNRLGDLHYEILYDGKHIRRHIDQIRASIDIDPMSETNTKKIERRRQSHVNTKKEQPPPRTPTPNLCAMQPSGSSTPQQNLQRRRSSNSAALNCSGAESEFMGFDLQEEDNENADQSETVPAENIDEHGGVEPGEMVPLRRSTRVRRRRVVFSP